MVKKPFKQFKLTLGNMFKVDNTNFESVSQLTLNMFYMFHKVSIVDCEQANVNSGTPYYFLKIFNSSRAELRTSSNSNHRPIKIGLRWQYYYKLLISFIKFWHFSFTCNLVLLTIFGFRVHKLPETVVCWYSSN